MKPQKLYFSKGEAIRFGWDTAKSNIGFFIKFFLFIIGISFGFGIFQGILQLPNILVLTFLSIVIGWLSQFAIQLMFFKVWLSFAEGKKPTFSQIFSVVPLLPKYLLASIVYTLIIIGGFLLLLIPAIIFSIKFQFYSYFIVALGKDVGVIESLKLSSKITEGVKINLLIFSSLSVLITIAGALALFVGLLWAIPTAGIAQAYIFKKLVSQSQIISPASSS